MHINANNSTDKEYGGRLRTHLEIFTLFKKLTNLWKGFFKEQILFFKFGPRFRDKKAF
jgi:hypothetical protein